MLRFAIAYQATYAKQPIYLGVLCKESCSLFRIYLKTMLESINAKQDQIIEDFELFDEWMDKYEYIIDLGKKLPPMEDSLKTDDFRIKGCQSSVWLAPQPQEDKLFFFADSDATIVKGLISMLLKVLSGEKPEDIAKADLYFIEKIGMNKHLAPTRSNGLLSMVKQIQRYGEVFSKAN